MGPRDRKRVLGGILFEKGDGCRQVQIVIVILRLVFELEGQVKRPSIRKGDPQS